MSLTLRLSPIAVRAPRLAAALLAGALGAWALGAGSAAAQAVEPRGSGDAACRWGGLRGERVLLCPEIDRDGRKIYRIVERRPARTRPAERTASRPAPRGADSGGLGFSPRAGASAGVGVSGSPLRVRPSGRARVGAGLGRIGSVRPSVGVGVGLPSGRASAGVGARVPIAPGVSFGSGLSVGLGKLF